MNASPGRLTFTATMAVLVAAAGSAHATSKDAATASLVEAEDVQLLEGTGENHEAVVTVELRYTSTAAQTVDYQILPGTATPGLDYLPIADGTLVFAPGETVQTIAVTIVADAIPECTETLTVRLQHWFHGDPMDVHIFILDDDGPDGGLADCPAVTPPGSSKDSGVETVAVVAVDGGAEVGIDGVGDVAVDAGIDDASAIQPSDVTITPSPADGPISAPTSPGSAKDSSGCSIAARGSPAMWLGGMLALILGLRRRRR
jgi:hypothetical protein